MNRPNPTLELGRLAGPVLIFGGPYSNLAATRATQQRAGELGIPAGRIVCTGDVVAYCAEPEETVQLVRDWGVAVVRGNCEEALGWEAPDCGCGFAEGSACSALAADWYRFAAGRIGEADRAWMRSLPKAIRFELNGRSILVVHGGVAQVNRYLFPSTPAAIKAAELDLAGTELLIGGHSGIPGGEKIGARAWLNVGAVGLPANDGTADGWYLLLSPAGGGLRCRWQRLSYPAEAAGHAMGAAGLTPGYAEALATGLWPSMDVLPAAERARRGVPIRLDDLVVGGAASGQEQATTRAT